MSLLAHISFSRQNVQLISTLISAVQTKPNYRRFTVQKVKISFGQVGLGGIHGISCRCCCCYFFDNELGATPRKGNSHIKRKVGRRNFYFGITKTDIVPVRALGEGASVVI